MACIWLQSQVRSCVFQEKSFNLTAVNAAEKRGLIYNEHGVIVAGL